jgi:exonuclease VII small subunit
MTDAQLQQLQQIVNQLSTDQQADDAATTALNNANSALTSAQGSVAAAQQTANTAAAQVSTDIQNLTAFVAGLINPPAQNPSAPAAS